MKHLLHDCKPAVPLIQRGHSSRRQTGVSHQTMFRAAVCVLLGALSACSGPCTTTVVRVAKAPDGQHAATLFHRDCGATTSFSTQISVLATGGKVSGGGNAFIADDNHDAAAVGPWRGSWADVQWLSPNHLLVRYAAKSRIFKHADEVAGVRITYQQTSR